MTKKKALRNSVLALLLSFAMLVSYIPLLGSAAYADTTTPREYTNKSADHTELPNNTNGVEIDSDKASYTPDENIYIKISGVDEKIGNNAVNCIAIYDKYDGINYDSTTMCYAYTGTGSYCTDVSDFIIAGPDKDSRVTTNFSLEPGHTYYVILMAGGDNPDYMGRWAILPITITESDDPPANEVISEGLDNMIWSWSSGPQVVTSGDKVFWGYMSPVRDYGIACYDMASGVTTKKSLGSAHSSRNTDNTGVAVALTSENKVLAAYATDTSGQKKMVVQVSDEPLSIESFSTATMNLATNNYAYFSQLVESNGNYYLFCRVNSTGSWTYYKSTDGGQNWTRPSDVILANTAQYLMKFVPTSDPNLIRVLMYSGPDGTTPELRMGFFNTTDDSLYNADAATIIGKSKVAYTSFDVVQDVESGKTQRLLDVAVTAPNDPRFIFASFTNTAGVNDSEYKLYDAGNVYKICDGGSALLDPDAPLGAAFRGKNDIIAIRNADGNDIIESYSIDSNGVTKKDTLYTHEVTDNSRAARPIIDANGKAVLWHEGSYSSPTSYDTDGRLLLLGSEMTPDPQEDPMLLTDKTEYEIGDPIMVTAKDGVWVGLYKAEDTPGNVDSFFWYYVKDYQDTPVDILTTTGSDRTVEPGEYKVVLFSTDGYAVKESVPITIKDLEEPPTYDGYELELVAPHAGKKWTIGETTYQTEGGFCQNTVVHVKAATPGDNKTKVCVYQADDEEMTSPLAWDNVVATDLAADNALINLADPTNGGSVVLPGYLDGGCYKVDLVRGTRHIKSIYFFIQGGHIYKTATYKWAEDNSTVTALRECAGCDRTETETAKTNCEETKPATCSETGIKTYTAEFKNTAFKVDPKEVTIPIDENNHNWDAGVPADGKDGVLLCTCNWCHNTKEETVEAVIDVANAIKNLSDATDVTISDKGAIETARAAYDALTDDQKALISEGTLSKLTAAEDALEAAEAAADDQEIADAVADMIAELPNAADVSVGDKDAIEAARAAYEDLTDDQKALISEDILSKLTDAEDALEAATEQAEADQAAADAAAEKIAAIPEEITVDDKAAIEAARAAYDALTDDQKALVNEDSLRKLADAEEALEKAEIEAKEAEADKEAADKVAAAITALPAAVTVNDKAAVEAARAAYDALSDAQKALISDNTLKKLTDAEGVIKAAEDKAAADKAAADKAAADKAAADKAAAEFAANGNAYIDPNLPKVKIKAPKKAKKSFTAKWKKLSKKQQKVVKGIEIEYSTTPDFSTAYKFKKVGKKKTSVKVKKLKSKQTYYVRAHTYVVRNGVKYVSYWSPVKKVKVK